jgi:hypothetical protein
MLTRRLGHFKYLSILGVILLVVTAAQDSYKHRHDTPHVQIQYDEDFEWLGSVSIDGEIQQSMHLCELAKLFIVAIPCCLLFVATISGIVFPEIFLPPSILARAPPVDLNFQHASVVQ